MKKFKLLTSLSSIAVLGTDTPLIATSCSSNNEYNISLSEDITYLGAAGEELYESAKYTYAIPVAVSMQKDYKAQEIKSLEVTSDDTSKARIVDKLDTDPVNVFRVIGINPGSAKLTIKAKNTDGHTEKTSINVNIYPFEHSGYIRFTAWDDFFSVPDYAQGFFPLPSTTQFPITVKNSAAEIEAFMQTYVNPGILAEGAVLAMYSSLIKKYGSQEGIGAALTFTGGQLYWRTTDNNFEFMYGISAKTIGASSYEVAWAEHGIMSMNNYSLTSVYQEGNVTNTTVYSNTVGPESMSTATGIDPSEEAKRGYWKVTFKDPKAQSEQNTFDLYIPYRDFYGKENIVIEQA